MISVSRYFAYYNEHDPYCAAWLRNLIAAGHIAPGIVDARSIEDVTPGDLLGFTQCHFFAGIGVWSHALRSAGWSDRRAVWTGSCPCQPFSAAGKGGGFTDERHLWPAWHYLIEQCQPDVVFGEQVASKDGLAWLDLVQTDLEGTGYAVGAFDLCAAGVGAPHIRQRLYFVADSHNERRRYGEHSLLRPETNGRVRTETILEAAGRGESGNVEHAAGNRRQQRRPESSGRGFECGRSESELAHTNGGNASTEREQRSGQHRQFAQDGGADRVEHAVQLGRQWRETPGGRHEHDGTAPDGTQGEHGPSLASSHWSAADWLPCIDGKARPVEPGTFPLAHGATARVGRLRAYGNAIVAPLAKEFIAAYMECAP